MSNISYEAVATSLLIMLKSSGKSDEEIRDLVAKEVMSGRSIVSGDEQKVESMKLLDDLIKEFEVSLSSSIRDGS